MNRPFMCCFVAGCTGAALLPASAFATAPIKLVLPFGQTAMYQGSQSAGSGTGEVQAGWVFQGATIRAVSATGSTLTVNSDTTPGVADLELTFPGVPKTVAQVASMRAHPNREISPYKMERLLGAPPAIGRRIARATIRQMAHVSSYTKGQWLHEPCSSFTGVFGLAYAQECDNVYFVQYTGGKTCCAVADANDAAAVDKDGQYIEAIHAGEWWPYNDTHTINERPTIQQSTGNCTNQNFQIGVPGFTWGITTQAYCDGTITPQVHVCPDGVWCGWGAAYDTSATNVMATGVAPNDETIVGWSEDAHTYLYFQYFTG